MTFEYKLQPLRIPTGWTVGWNTFTEIDPLSIQNANSDQWFNFDQDMFQAINTHFNLIIDLGWYPNLEPNGIFKLVLITLYDTTEQQVASWDQPLKKLTTRDKSKIVTAIEDWMNDH